MPTCKSTNSSTDRMSPHCDRLPTMSLGTQPFRLAIVIPTRNRARMAARSADSLLASCGNRDDVAVIISDNSTDPIELSILDAYMAGSDPRVVLIRPPSSLSMTAHWNFALDHAMTSTDCTHFTFLTDRMLVREPGMHQLLDVLAAFPDEVLSFTYDRIEDVRLPAIYRPLPRSGELVRIKSAKLLAMSARMTFPSCLPRMLNSIAPKQHLEDIRTYFGNVFSSTSPDFCFCYRTLDLRESLLFLDRSVLINYGQGRSNGNSFARGVMTRDSEDFVQNLGAGGMNHATPLPEFLTVGNAVVHEYCVGRRASRSGTFPKLMDSAYTDMLAAEVRLFVDPQLTKESLAKLRQHGWKDRWPTRVWRWKKLATKTALGLLARRFVSVDEAISYASVHEGPTWPWLPHPAKSFGSRIAGWKRASGFTRNS